MIVYTSEFESIKCAKKYACYSGVVPFKNPSRKSILKRAHVSHFANKEAKSLMHLADMPADT